MKLVVNGESVAKPDGLTVLGLLRDLGAIQTRVAVVVNDQVVPSERREACVLKDGDRVEILTFAGGG
jgi:sulfur carrier protein